MNEEERMKIISDNYAEKIVEYRGDLSRLALYNRDTVNIVNNNYAVVYYPVTRVEDITISESGFVQIPKLYGLSDTTTLDEMGVRKIQNLSFLNLRGQGVLLGFLDTGIDYTRPLFKNADDTSRILSIWDQTIENREAANDIFYYGTEYNREAINRALKNEKPLSIVPSVDEVGHGTMIAGLAGGSRIEESDFEGVATLAEYVVVKLKPAKQNIRDYFTVQEGVVAYQENDIMFAVNYLVNFAQRMNRPIAICIAVGANLTAHDGRSSFGEDLGDLAGRTGVAIVVAAGNEGNVGHHYYGTIEVGQGFNTIELNVGEGERGFPMQIWGYEPGTYSIDILSPSGEYIPRIPARLEVSREIRFLFENTVININYLLVEGQTGDQLILLHFHNPTQGIWKIKVFGSGSTGLSFHSWLPLKGFITNQTFFVRPNSETTIVEPGNVPNVITITAYNHKNNSIYLDAGKGYTRTGVVKPDLAAPGVEVYSPMLGGEFGGNSGTSIAAAYTTGIAAMMLEWGIVRRQFAAMGTLQIKNFLIRGARRSESITYPNKEWGYGILDIFETFNSLRGGFES